MKAKSRMMWTKLHTYFACFFLPFAVLYVVSGVLYLLDIKGGATHEYEYKIDMPDGWPESEQKALSLVEQLVIENNHLPFPSDYYSEDHEWVSWYNYKKEISIIHTDDEYIGKLVVKNHDFIHQMLLIHKGFSGVILWIFGFLLGASILFSLISGLVLALSVPKYRSPSIIATGLGLVTLAVLFIVGT